MVVFRVVRKVGKKPTSRIGSWPLIPALMVVFVNLTSRSFPLYFPSIEIVMSRSLIVWVHL